MCRKLLHNLLNGRCELEEETLSHIRKCRSCIQLLEEFSQAQELETWLPKTTSSSFDTEVEFK